MVKASLLQKAPQVSKIVAGGPEGPSHMWKSASPPNSHGRDRENFSPGQFPYASSVARGARKHKLSPAGPLNGSRYVGNELEADGVSQPQVKASDGSRSPDRPWARMPWLDTEARSNETRALEVSLVLPSSTVVTQRISGSPSLRDTA
ncbi:MAG: hypothetical protein ACI835_004995 [Planctomycetota bacterium]|jgi:hypothetical protein